jgi:LacI family transcriptional regulator
MRRVTIEDVAQAAGVSRQTVSRAMNDKDEISQETKQRVMQAIQELGYRPNRLAQGMVTQRTYTVGLVVSNITNPFFPEVTRGVQDTALANEYNVLLCNTDDTAEVELQSLRSLAAQHADGIILFSHQASDDELRTFADSYRPLVLINRICEHPHISVLLVDNYRGAQLAADYFADHQHTQIGMLTNDSPTYSQSRRLLGFRQQLEARGLQLPEERVIPEVNHLEGGYRAAHQLLTRYPEVTAIFTYNDLMAVGAIRACSELGRRIPADVAIIGFDGIQMSTMTTPSLSTIYVDKYAMGQQAMNRLIAMIEAPDVTFAPIELNVELILREST